MPLTKEQVSWLPDDAVDDFAAVLERYMSSAALVGGEYGNAQLGTFAQTEVALSPAVSSFLGSYIGTFAKEWVQEQAAAISAAVRAGQEGGETMDQIASRVGGLFDGQMGEAKALTIARTETIRSSNMGALDTYLQAGVERKQWSADGAGTCEICQGLDGIQVRIDGGFETDGGKVDAPPAHPNCRCSILPVLSEYGKAGGADTADIYAGPDGTWAPERQTLHDRIMEDVLGSATAQDKPTFYMTGGGPAGGKGALVRSIDYPADIVRIDPDQIKAMLPEYRSMLAEGDPRAAAFVHEESSYLAKRIARQAVESRYNILFDGTGNNTLDNLSSKIASWTSGGHRLVADYVTVDPELAVQRAKERATKTGRFVPVPYIRGVHRNVAEVLPQAIDRGLFTDLRLWDTTGRPATLIAQVERGVFSILDQDKWAAFLARGG